MNDYLVSDCLSERSRLDSIQSCQLYNLDADNTLSLTLFAIGALEPP